jgi:hypothetical protein
MPASVVRFRVCLHGGPSIAVHWRVGSWPLSTDIAVKENVRCWGNSDRASLNVRRRCVVLHRPKCLLDIVDRFREAVARRKQHFGANAGILFNLRHPGSGAMLLLALLVWGLLAIIVGIEASVRGRSALGWSTLAFLISPFVAGGILWLSTWHTSVDDQSLEQNIQVAQLALPGLGPVEFWMKDRG